MSCWRQITTNWISSRTVLISLFSHLISSNRARMNTAITAAPCCDRIDQIDYGNKLYHVQAQITNRWLLPFLSTIEIFITGNFVCKSRSFYLLLKFLFTCRSLVILNYHHIFLIERFSCDLKFNKSIPSPLIYYFKKWSIFSWLWINLHKCAICKL